MITRESIDEFYACRLANDAEACLRQYSTTTHIVIAGDPTNNPISGTLDGAGFRGALQDLVDTWQWHLQDVQALLIEGNHAAVHYMLDVTHTPTGKRFVTEVCDLLTAENGKVTELRQFLDTATVRAVTNA